MKTKRFLPKVLFAFCIYFLTPGFCIFSETEDEYHKIYTEIEKAKDWIRGESLFTRAAKEFPNNFWFKLYLSSCLQKLKKFGESRALIDKLLKESPEEKYIQEHFTWFLYDEGWYLMDSGKKTEALESFKSAYERDPESAWLWVGYAYGLKGNGFYREAAGLLEKGMKRFPEHKGIRDNYIDCELTYGWQFQKEKNYEKAMEIIHSMYAFEPKNESVIGSYCDLLREMGRPEEAITVLTEGRKLFPESKWLKDSRYWALVNIGWKKQKENDLDNALSVFKEAYGLDPNETSGIIGYSYTYRLKKEFDKAIRILEKAYAAKPDDAWIRDDLSYAFIEKANELAKAKLIAEAAVYFENAGKLNSTSDTYLFAFSSFLADQGKFEPALKYLDEGTVRYPDNRYFKENIKWMTINYAQSFSIKGDFASAIKILSKRIAQFPEECWFYYYLSEYQLKSGNADSAAASTILFGKVRTNQGKNDSDIELSHYYQLDALFYYLEGKKRYTDIFNIIEKEQGFFRESYLLDTLKGNALYFSGKKTEGTALIYQSSSNYCEMKKIELVPIILDPPLKGYFITGGNKRQEPTHAGFYQNCYDFWGSDMKGVTRKNKSNTNADYLGFGAALFSPVDGIVADVEDGKPDLSPSGDVRFENGNYISIKDADGISYWFVHTRYKSARFKKGDRVKHGQVVAELGNSGMTSLPHLHYAVYKDGWLISIPVKFNRYKVIDKESGAAIPKENETPLDTELILFE